jgi:hypothetical protein
VAAREDAPRSGLSSPFERAGDVLLATEVSAWF